MWLEGKAPLRFQGWGSVASMCTMLWSGLERPGACGCEGGVVRCRRGAREAEELLVQLCGTVDEVRSTIVDHMEREEASLLPVLVAHLCVAEQRAIVWGTLRSMPLRLLERVLPWLAGTPAPLEKCG